MELGQKIRQARLEAGLSQRQLCGDVITRNMLSQIENGTAHPSMDTLRFLAERLGRPISYFLEEQAVTSPNQQIMEAAREAFAAGAYDRVPELLEQYRHPDPVFGWEQGLLTALCAMAAAEQAIAQGRLPYAVRLLEQAGESGRTSPYYDQWLERRRLLLLAEAQPGRETAVAGALPADDRELLLRAKAALEEENAPRAEQYLDAAEDHRSEKWNFLRGQAYLARGQFDDAAECFRAAEARYPKDCAAYLEHCCRELEDYKGAYFYACKLRELEG